MEWGSGLADAIYASKYERTRHTPTRPYDPSKVLKTSYSNS